MVNIKNIIIYTFVFIFFISTIFLFVNADQYNVVDSDFQKEDINIDIVKKIELSNYYGISSLLINLHLELGNVSGDEQIFYGINLLNDMKYYVDLDIIPSLEYSFDLQYSLDQLLLNMSNLINHVNFAKTDLENNMVKLKQDKLDCDEKKEISDKNFTLALRDFDSQNMKKYLDDSLEYDWCAGESRIYYNVENKIYQQINFYYEILKNKYTYYSRNRDDIIFNYQNILYNLSKE